MSAPSPSEDEKEPSPRQALLALGSVSSAVLLIGGTWFSGTAAIPALRREWGLNDEGAAWLTIGVQLGFIAGTILYALLNLSDVFRARRVLFVSAVCCACFNGGFAWLSSGLGAAVVFRFLTGVTLAGVYPVGMKIVASWFRTGLGWRLGVMVGALVLGTASPYLIQALGAGSGWRALTSLGSLSALAGAALSATVVRDGPYLPKRAPFDPKVVFRVFRHAPFRHTALGYFGHMWELYAFWSLVGFYLAGSFEGRGEVWTRAIPAIAFFTVAVGSLGCLLGGLVSRRMGERNVALVSLVASASMCVLSGMAFRLPPAIMVAFLLVWGFFVVSDSPQFSALAARYCPLEYTGTALTVQNGIGFAVTVLSIRLLPLLARLVSWRWAFTFLALGPALGAFFMARLPGEKLPTR